MTSRVTTAENGLVHMSTLTTNAPAFCPWLFPFPLNVDNVGYCLGIVHIAYMVTANGY